jgi:hypothetical protein
VLSKVVWNLHNPYFTFKNGLTSLFICVVYHTDPFTLSAKDGTFLFKVLAGPRPNTLPAHPLLVKETVLSINDYPTLSRESSQAFCLLIGSCNNGSD